MVRKKRGIGLFYALVLAAVLIGLASIVALLTRQRVAQLQRTQWAVQARLNARSGLNQYRATHRFTPGIIQCVEVGSCECSNKGGDLLFVGRCRGVSRALLVPSGNVRKAREVDP